MGLAMSLGKFERANQVKLREKVARVLAGNVALVLKNYPELAYEYEYKDGLYFDSNNAKTWRHSLKQADRLLEHFTTTEKE